MNDQAFFLAESMTKIRDMKSKKQEVIRQIQKSLRRQKSIQKSMEDLDEVKHLISSEMISIQKGLKEDIDSLVTIALRTVYSDRDIEFSLDFGKTPSGTSTYKPSLIENGEKYDPKDEQCGGALDVSSYNLQTILMNFEKPAGRPFRLNDEPFKFLGGGELAEKAVSAAKQINSEIGVQSVIISHDEAAISSADKIYRITHNGRYSTCTLVSGEEQEKKPISKVLPTKKKIERIKA